MSEEDTSVAAPSSPKPAATKSRIRRVLSHPLTHLLAAVLVVALMQAFVVKVFAVPSGSMENTLEVGDRILVNRFATEPQTGDIIVFRADETLWPQGSSSSGTGVIGSVKHAVKWVFGDVLGFGPTTGHTLVKRVIGAEGQTVSCCGANGGVVVDGVELEEPYIYEDPPFTPGTLDCESTPVSTRCFAPIEVPEGMLLVMGDHRGSSSDGVSQCRGSSEASGGASDCARFVRADDVYGEVFSVIWPLSRFGSPEATR